MSRANNEIPNILRRDERGFFLLCSRCKTETPVYNPQKLAVVVCVGCYTVYDASSGQQQQLKKQGKDCPDPVVPLYSKCTFDNKEYTVVGYAQKHERGDREAMWEEYTLADGQGAYAFLSVSNGHWILLHECGKPEQFNPEAGPVVFTNRDALKYELFSTYRQTLMMAGGEFPYDVTDTKDRQVAEYIHPPHIFTLEDCRGTQTYFQGRYIKPSKVEKAFGEHRFRMPAKTGVGSCQPFMGGIHPGNFFRISLVFFVLSFLVYMAMGAGGKSSTLADMHINAADTNQARGMVSPSFDIKGSRPSVVRIDYRSNVFNDWIESEITLVNEKTGAERSVLVGLEYYAGTVDGESWSEGDASESLYIDQVEPGRYHIETSVYSSNLDPLRTFSLIAWKYSATPWNFWLLSLSLLGIAVFIAIMGHLFNNERHGITSTE